MIKTNVYIYIYILFWVPKYIFTIAHIWYYISGNNYTYLHFMLKPPNNKDYLF